ncbi:MAG: aldehyde dehydrogenase family protein, partial [Burkholderiaceae bacterium]
LIHPRLMEKVLSYAQVAVADGATVAVGGQRCQDVVGVKNAGNGYYVQPTLYTGATESMRIAQEEIFGPVLTVLPFDDESEAVALANNVRYGLAGYLWTSDLGRANRVSLALDAGMIWVNSENVRHLPTPFGGMKSSGIGRDGGDYSFDFYMETKNVALALGTHKTPKMGVS